MKSAAFVCLHRDRRAGTHCPNLSALEGPRFQGVGRVSPTLVRGKAAFGRADEHAIASVHHSDRRDLFEQSSRNAKTSGRSSIQRRRGADRS